MDFLGVFLFPRKLWYMKVKAIKREIAEHSAIVLHVSQPSKRRSTLISLNKF